MEIIFCPHPLLLSVLVESDGAFRHIYFPCQRNGSKELAAFTIFMSIRQPWIQIMAPARQGGRIDWLVAGVL